MSKIKKVVIPVEIARAIEMMRRKGWSQSNLLNTVEFLTEDWKPARHGDNHAADISKWLSEDTDRLPIYASAIINGYTVESTPEEKVREYYDQAAGDAHSGDYDLKFTGEARMEAIEFFADAYGIKIEGVNA